MKDNKGTGISTVVLVVVLVVVLAGSALLYNNLLKKDKMGQAAAPTPTQAPQVTALEEQGKATAPPEMTEPPVKETEASVKATNTPVKETEAPVKATNTPVKATEAPVKATNTPVKATEAPVKATNTPVKETEAPVKATNTPGKATEASEATEPPVPKNLAPDFTMMTLTGKKVKLSDYVGKPIVLNFWASWCGPCRSEMPYFDALYKEMKEDVEFVMVNLTTALSGSGETPEKAKKLVEEAGYQFPVFLDLEQEGAKAYGIISIPQTYFINSLGEVVTYKIGTIYEEELRQNIEKILD